MSSVSRGARITWRVIKGLFFAVIFSVIILLLWRIFSSGDPKSMKALAPNEALATAYEREGDGLYMFRQEQRSITSGKKNYGYFSVTKCVFIPEANQVQIVVRYNNSTLRALTADYGLEQIPPREAELFDVTLTVATDLTPENKEDNLWNKEDLGTGESVKMIRVHPTSVTGAQKQMYNYRRFVFDLDTAGLSLKTLTEEELMLAVFADVYYNGDIRYEENPYGSLCLYTHLDKTLTVPLERIDKKALDGYLGR